MSSYFGLPRKSTPEGSDALWLSVKILLSVTAQKAPIMNSAPWAKFTTPSVPKINVRPSAMSA